MSVKTEKKKDKITKEDFTNTKTKGTSKSIAW